MTQRELYLKILWQYYGTPYRWGGDDPSSIDCSGLKVEALQSVGILARGEDASADMLYRMFPAIMRHELEPGDLVFWLNSRAKAIHVGSVIENIGYYMGAEGGGSSTQTLADAWGGNAFVKVRPIESRGDVTTRRYARWTEGRIV